MPVGRLRGRYQTNVPYFSDCFILSGQSSNSECLLYPTSLLPSKVVPDYHTRGKVSLI